MNPVAPAALLALALAAPAGLTASARVPAAAAHGMGADAPRAAASSATGAAAESMVLYAPATGALVVDTPGANPRAGVASAARTGSRKAGGGGRDAWLGEDKLKHLSASFALTEFGYAGLRMLGTPHHGAEAGALAAASLAGVMKEAWDARAGRGFSFRDLTWDVVGVALGALVVRRTR